MPDQFYYITYLLTCLPTCLPGRQGLPEFVPDQFMVLYGIKTLAIKNINEFLYGVRVASKQVSK